ncbi:MAG: succinate dehydrogenase cytochrome b558 subunit [Planctomycetota bacterium]
METNPSFLARHEFLIRRLHSLSGLIPVGAYMCIHLLTNASTLDSSATFQRAVYQIHSLGHLLPLVEWVFIFIPILFHAVIGVVIIRGGLPNYGSYKYTNNLRYTLQRATGMIAFVFIMWHVFHMHGWFHFDAWREGVAEPLGGAQFAPYNAASSLGAAMSGVVYPIFYAIGVLSSVFHLANGIWTMGITWGVWVSPAAQKRADRVCIVFGVALAFVGLSAIGGAVRIGDKGKLHDEAVEVENKMWTAKTASGEVDAEENLHKRSHTTPGHAAAE